MEGRPILEEVASLTPFRALDGLAEETVFKVFGHMKTIFLRVGVLKIETYCFVKDFSVFLAISIVGRNLFREKKKKINM